MSSDLFGVVLAVVLLALNAFFVGAEFALLCVFADHPNVVMSRERLLELSGTDPAEVFDRAIDLRITRLRRKIEPVPGDPTVIRTVRGHGGGYEYLPSEGPNYGR